MIRQVVQAYLAKWATTFTTKPWSHQKPPKGLQTFHDEHATTLPNLDLVHVEDYGGNHYDGINSALRSGLDLEDNEHVKSIDRAHAKSYLKDEKTILWRGMEWDIRHPLCKRMNQLRKGSYLSYDALQKLRGFTYKELGFVSTSLNMDVASGFGPHEGILFQIHAPLGTPALYLSAAHTVNEDKTDMREFASLSLEHEVLLKRGLTFRVLNIFEQYHKPAKSGRQFKGYLISVEIVL